VKVVRNASSTLVIAPCRTTLNMEARSVVSPIAPDPVALRVERVNSQPTTGRAKFSGRVKIIP
jgi:hypothetical protein